MRPDSSFIEVTLPGGESRRLPKGSTVEDALTRRFSPDGHGYLGALVNNDLASLSFPLEVDCLLRPVTLADQHGYRIYRRSVAFLAAKTARELYPEATFTVEHSLGTGLYCTFEIDGNTGITKEQVRRIEDGMRGLVAANLPIERTKMSFLDAVRQFEAEAQWDKYNLLRYRNPPVIAIYACGEFSDLAHGVMACCTGMLSHFSLHHYAPGLVLQFPTPDRPDAVAPFEEQPQLFTIFQEHKRWGRILGLRTVGQINQLIAENGISEFIHIAEALHEKKIAQIADRIYAHRDRLRMILIAGPSSAGKTTLSKRLMIQLRVNGLRPVSISVDDYFVNREDTPRDNAGDYDFEHLEAIDLPLLNQHLEQLDQGREIELPRFDFEQGRRQFRGETLRLDQEQILILEGIHCLNPRLTAAVPREHKFQIYVSALGQLNLDQHNRISTTDNRLLRRLVRDHAFRGHPALTTLRMWPSVRRGERRWIFPNQAQADIAFNSALDYELAVLKPMAEPLLSEVKPSDGEYAVSRNLLEFLQYFLAAPESLVPPNSILREYIGGSGFQY
jgi:uridine kinase